MNGLRQTNDLPSHPSLGTTVEAESTEDEVYYREEERWELTWPIWHMLPREERRSLAHKHGYKTIGEFEEYMSLQRAVEDSSAALPYENRLLYNEEPARTFSLSADECYKHISSLSRPEEDDDDEQSVDVDADEDNRLESQDLPIEELLQRGGRILILSDDMLHRIFSYLPVDTYATLALVSPHWKSFTRTEATYKRLCERLYLKQCQRRTLHVSRFGNSYRTMLEKRPRVRAGGGVYVMKYARVRKIQRDMWTEVRESVRDL
jgi:F-box protein 9